MSIAALRSFRGIPNALAKSSPFPIGIIPILFDEPLMPFATSCTVPSPPMATIKSKLLSLRPLAISMACPVPSVMKTSLSKPEASSAFSILSRFFPSFPSLAFGLAMHATRSTMVPAPPSDFNTAEGRNHECGLGRSAKMTDAEQYMRRAIKLAEKGRHRVMPNPLVGCVLVKDGEIVAEGWHDHLGGLHAEQMAIADAESKGIGTRGTTAYVTLEPCNHFGRTPPCTEALLWAGVSKVVIGALDPNPTVRGEGAKKLIDLGVEVVTGVMEEECESQMEEFMHWCRSRRPFVTLKASTDTNGLVDGDPSKPAFRFSSDASLRLAHDLRANSMAILVGVGTVIRDDPSLTVRGPDIDSERAAYESSD